MTAVAMTEDELLEGVTMALGFAGWRYTHIIRSDGVTQGDGGVPDIIAVHPTRSLALAWELKGSAGKPTGDQVAWIAALAAPKLRLDARFLYPGDYDRALAVITGAIAGFVTCMICGQPADRILDDRVNAGLCIVHDGTV